MDSRREAALTFMMNNRGPDSITRDLQSSISFEEAVTAAQNDRSAWRSFALALCGRAHGSSKVK